MTKEEIIKITNETLVEKFKLDPSSLKPESTVAQDLGFSSIDMVDIVVYLEEAFNIELKSKYDNLDKIKTLGSIYNYIEKTIRMS
ncbi:MAG: phosphopantetheine-binding protein [Elusimicrobiota bacterium]|nr:phosphopantetheine-binding protein [Elusimicrobiota bacterium]